MPNKLPVPRKRLSANDVETYVEDINEALQAVDDSITAYNQQIDAGETAEQHANTALNTVPIIEGYVPTKADFDRNRLNELNNFPVSGCLNVDKDTSFEFQQVAGWENKFKIKANKTRIDGVWHDYADTTITNFDAPNGFQNKDLVSADFVDLAAAITAGGTGLSQSYLSQRVAHYLVQDDIVAAAGQSTAYINDPTNNFYHDNGVLRQRIATFEKARLLETVEQKTGQAFTNSVNAMVSLGWTLSANTLGEFEKDGKKAVYIATVTSRSQSAYHPSFNQYGAKTFAQSGLGFNRTWDNITSTNITDTSTCFVPFVTGDAAASSPSGYIGSTNGSGRHDGKLYNAIYASDVEYLYMSSKKLPLAEIHEKYKRTAIFGDVCGLESVPALERITFDLDTHFNNYLVSGGNVYIYADQFTSTGNGGSYEYPVADVMGRKLLLHDKLTGKTIYGKIAFGSSTHVGFAIADAIFDDGINGSNDVNADTICFLSVPQIHQQSSLIWTDIIGAPAKIEGLFTTVGSKFYGAKGIRGEYNFVIPDAATVHPLTRKSLDTTSTYKYSDDGGATWNSTSRSVDTIANTVGAVSVGRVLLHHYETQAHFTQDAVGITQLTDWSPVYATNHHEEAILTSSLIGEVATGTDPSEELAITKIVSDVISHTAETLTPVVKYSTAIGVKDGVAYLLFNCDDSGVIDSSNIKATALPYFITEE